MRFPRMRSLFSLATVTLLLALGTLVATSTPRGDPARAAVNPCEPWPICKINHIVMIVQENRSFDHYFGTYESPGGQNVAGIPRRPNGDFIPCIPDPPLGHCVKPYHSKNQYNVGGPHSNAASDADVNGGAMNGFVRTALWGPRTGYCVENWLAPSCKALTGPGHQPDVVSFHNRNEIPNYWAYADYGVLQDHMFEPVDSWTLPSHMYLVSAWAATCTNDFNVNTCHSDPKVHKAWNYPWADITELLRGAGVSWNYFVGDGTDLSCMGKSSSSAGPTPRSPCNPTHSNDASSEGWLPILWFESLNKAHDKGSVKHVSDFFTQIGNNQLADVTWFVPPPRWSEHPGHSAIRPGERYVTRVVNAIGESPFWNDTAIFIAWDDWGGFYDHVKPINVGDGMGYGIRVPGLMISPYAKESYVDHQTLSFDAYLKFIEDRFLGGARLDPKTDGWPDPRPLVREDVTKLGDLTDEFDFDQTPRSAPVLELPASGPAGWPYPETRSHGFGAGE